MATPVSDMSTHSLSGWRFITGVGGTSLSLAITGGLPGAKTGTGVDAYYVCEGTGTKITFFSILYSYLKTTIYKEVFV